MEIDRLRQLTQGAFVSETVMQRGVEKLQFFLSSDEVERKVPAHLLDIVKDYHGCKEAEVEVGQPIEGFRQVTVNLGERVWPSATIEMQGTLDAVNLAPRLGPQDVKELKESFASLAVDLLAPPKIC